MKSEHLRVHGGAPRPAARGTECHCVRESPLSSVDQFYCYICRWGHCYRVDPALQRPLFPSPDTWNQSPDFSALSPGVVLFTLPRLFVGGSLKVGRYFLVLDPPRLKSQILHIPWTYLIGWVYTTNFIVYSYKQGGVSPSLVTLYFYFVPSSNYVLSVVFGIWDFLRLSLSLLRLIGRHQRFLLWCPFCLVQHFQPTWNFWSCFGIVV